MDPLQKFSPHVEDCVKTLEDFGDHPNDKTAVALVRLQGILERVRLDGFLDRFSGGFHYISVLITTY
jgi:hypothetical protein